MLWACAAGAQESDVPLPSAPPDTALPRSGVDAPSSDLREHLLRANGDAPAPPPGVSPPNLQITGQFGASEEYTDNAGIAAGAGGRNAGSDFVTAFQPGITIIDTSQRLTVNVNYHPIAQVYAENTSFSQFEEQGSGDILATLLPGWLYLDVRGTISQQAIFGGLGPASTVTLSPAERETVSSYAISPYVTRTFGGTGTAQVGLSYSDSATSTPGNLAAMLGAGQPGLNGGPGFGNAASLEQAQFLQNEGAYGSSNQGTERAYANFTTGENLGRILDRASIDASFYTGSGALADGRRVLLTDDGSYALTRLVTLLGEAGYESLDYPRSDYRYVGPIGSGGVKLNFAHNSSFTLEYRYVDGFGAIFAQFSVQASPRVRVFGGYSESISTFQQDQQNALLDGADDVTGVAANGLDAAPLLETSNFFGSNQNLNKLNRLDVSASYVGDFDTVTLSVNRETTTPVGRQVSAFAPITTNGLFGSITETHLLSDTISLSGSVQYGSNQTGLVASASGDTVSVSADLNKTFPRAITAYLRFGGTYYVAGSPFAASGFSGQSGNQTTITLGALKTF